jgi:hypothetical protein
VLLLLSIFSSTVTAQSHKVALLLADDGPMAIDVKLKLEVTNYFDTVDIIDTHFSTPTLSQLEQYCSVLVDSSNELSDPDALGDVLADYVDRGGAVVTALYSNVETARSDILIQGRWAMDNYWAIQPGPYVAGVPSTMIIQQSGHPILAGVTSFDGGSLSPHIGINTLHPEAQAVANWSIPGNTPLIATREIKSVRRVDLGFWPVSSDSHNPNGWNAATDGDVIIANSLRWVCPFDHTGPAVAIMGSPGDPDWNYDVRAKLLSQRVFSKVDVFDTNTVVPSTQEMQDYCSILAYTDNGIAGPDPAAYGDNLADYVDAGGGVVTAVFSHTSNAQIIGRFNDDNYWVIQPGAFGNDSVQTLGTVYLPEHPLMTGVKTFNGGTHSFRSGSTIVSGAARIADWSTGEALMATRILNGLRRADLGFFPPSSDARSDYWDASTDGARMMANALLYTCPTSKPAVAILGSDSITLTNQEIQDKIKLTGKFSFVDTIETGFATPSLSDLRPYRAVMVWSNFAPADPITLGNNLADYVDAGGGVVLALSSFVPGSGIDGRFKTDNYWVLSPGGIIQNGLATLGNVDIPSHPIMSGVTTFSGGILSMRQNTSFEALSMVVARWTDGVPLIATRLINNIRRVDLNFYPVSSDSVSALWDRNTDGDKIMANALNWVAVRYQDDFSDLNADDWTPVKGIWTAASGSLSGTTNAKTDNFAPFQCDTNCSIGADVTISTVNTRASILGWNFDKKNYVEIRLMEDKEKVLITQKANGSKVAKSNVRMAIDPGITYKVRVDYDGTYFFLYIDDAFMVSIPAGAPPAGTLGVRVKKTTNLSVTALFDRFIVY